LPAIYLKKNFLKRKNVTKDKTMVIKLPIKIRKSGGATIESSIVYSW